MIDVLTNESFPEGFRVMRRWGWHLQMKEIEQEIRWSQETIRMYGREVPLPRLTCWMGSGSYTYSGIRHQPGPVPRRIGDLVHQLSVQERVGFNSVLANMYRHGDDSVGWHADDEPELGTRPVIASLSLGAPRVFAVREIFGARRRWDITLGHGDLVVMSGRSQCDFEHSVTKTKKLVGPRINLTFRLVRE